MDHFHKILEDTPGYVRPGKQVDTESFLSARNKEIQALLREIRELFNSNGSLLKCNSFLFSWSLQTTGCRLCLCHVNITTNSHALSFPNAPIIVCDETDDKQPFINSLVDSHVLIYILTVH